MTSYNIGEHTLYPHVWYSTETVAIPRKPFAKDVTILVCSGTDRTYDDVPSYSVLATTVASDLKTPAWYFYTSSTFDADAIPVILDTATSWMIIDTSRDYEIKEDVWYSCHTVHTPSPSSSKQLLFIDKDGFGLSVSLYKSVFLKNEDAFAWVDEAHVVLDCDATVRNFYYRWKIITIASE